MKSENQSYEQPVTGQMGWEERGPFLQARMETTVSQRSWGLHG